jgi:glycine betaine/proline transport system substrate-binding protein
MNEQEATMRRPMTRRFFLACTGAALAGPALLSATGHVAQAQSARNRRSITLGIIGWDEDTAISTLTKILLVEDLGYTSVRETLADVGILFEGVGAGDLAAFQDVWMPNHTAYYNRVKNEVEMLPPWFIGTTKFSMAVPSYMHITSIAQLNATKAKVIYGIEPGAVITDRIEKYVLPEYRLKQTFLPSSTAAMLAEVARAYKTKEPFVFIAWSPHWMNYKYDITYLSDPKGALGNLTKPSRLTTIVHKGLKQSDPVAYTLMRSIQLTAEQVNQMEFEINKAGDPQKGVRAWLQRNREVTQPWVNAAKKAQGV